MMHCSVNSWRQLSSSQTFVESGERRKSLGEGASVTSRKAPCMAAKLMLAADLCWCAWPQLHWEQALAQQGGCCENHTCLAFSSIIVPCSQCCTRRDLHLGKSICWSPCMNCSPTHTLTHPTSLCERSTLAGNSGLLSCSNTHQQCQAQFDHSGWI